MKLAVKVVDGNIWPENKDLSEIKPETIQSINVINGDSVSKNKELLRIYGENAINGILFVKTKQAKSAEIKDNQTNDKEEKLYQVVEQMPQFPGGEKSLLNFINQNVRYPVMAQQNGIQGTVIIRFVVSTSGKVKKVEVIRSLNRDCDNEAVRVIKLLPDFIPGKQNGVNVAVWYTLPIRFKLQ